MRGNSKPDTLNLKLVMSTNRRKFLRHLSSSVVLLGAGSFTSLEAKEQIERKILFREKRFTSNDQINIATIGMGIMGYQDTNTAIKVPGVKLVACCDLYDGRLERAKELYGRMFIPPEITRRYSTAKILML